MFESGLLKDKVILITGGGSGIGREMAERFLKLGAKVAICGRREEVLKKTVAELMPEGEIFAARCDIREPMQIEEMMTIVFAHFGRIDVLVNNAAGNFISPTERLSTRAVDAVLNITLHGTFYCTLELGKRWIAAQQRGTVLNIVTTYASTGSGYVVPSAVAKAGVIALTRSLAVEWAQYGIRHVAIAPGPFPTEGAWSRLMPTPEVEQRLMDRLPFKRVGQMEELTNLAAFLVSDGATYINGEVVTIDSGEWLKGAGTFSTLESVKSEEWDELARKIKGK